MSAQDMRGCDLVPADDDEEIPERYLESPRAAASSNTEMPPSPPYSPTDSIDYDIAGVPLVTHAAQEEGRPPWREEYQEPATGGSGPAAAAPMEPLSPAASTAVASMELGAPAETCVSLTPTPSASPEGLPTISELEQGGTPGEVRAVHDSIDSILLRIMDYNRSIHMILHSGPRAVPHQRALSL